MFFRKLNVSTMQLSSELNTLTNFQKRIFSVFNSEDDCIVKTFSFFKKHPRDLFSILITFTGDL